MKPYITDYARKQENIYDYYDSWYMICAGECAVLSIAGLFISRFILYKLRFVESCGVDTRVFDMKFTTKKRYLCNVQRIYF
jgi:hypothetical protein